MACRISKPGWIIIGIGAAITDVVQFLIGFFGVILSTFAIGAFLVAANDVADPFIGGAIAVVLQLLGVSLIQHPSRLLSLLCVGGIDELTGGVASFWVLDIWYIYTTVQKEEAGEKAQAEQSAFESQFSRQPLNTNERREPSYQSAPDTVAPNHLNGRRAPNSRLQSGKIAAFPENEDEDQNYGDNYADAA